MVEGIVIDILKSGSIAFIGSKINKVAGQKEISEMIAAGGWCVVGVDVVRLLIPLIQGVQGFFKAASGFFDKIDHIVNTLSNIPLIGQLIQRGLQ